MYMLIETCRTVYHYTYHVPPHNSKALEKVRRENQKYWEGDFARSKFVHEVSTETVKAMLIKLFSAHEDYYYFQVS